MHLFSISVCILRSLKFFFLDFYPGQNRSYLFTEFNGRSLQKIFNAKEDSIFESGREVFEVFMTTDNPLVEISSDRDVQKISILDDEGKNA